MNNFFNFYTHWAVILSLLTKWTKISVFPSVIYSLAVSTLLGFYYNSKLDVMLFVVILHSIPLLWTKVNLTPQTMLYNMYIGLAYITFVNLQGINVYNIYDKQYKFLNKPDGLKNLFLKGQANICFFC